MGNIKKLYDALKDGYNIGTYDEFRQKLQSEENRRKVYEAAKGEFNLGSYEDYTTKLGFTYNPNTQQPKEEAPATTAAAEDAAVANPVTTSVGTDTTSVEQETATDSTAAVRIPQEETPANATTKKPATDPTLHNAGRYHVINEGLVAREGFNQSYLVETDTDWSPQTKHNLVVQAEDDFLNEATKDMSPDERKYFKAEYAKRKAQEAIERAEKIEDKSTRKRIIEEEEEKEKQAQITIDNNPYYQNYLTEKGKEYDKQMADIEQLIKEVKSGNNLTHPEIIDLETMTIKPAGYGHKADKKINRLSIAARLTQQAKDVITAPTRYGEEDTWLGNRLEELKSAGKGAADILKDPTFWDISLSQKDNFELLTALKEVEKALGRVDDVGARVAEGDLSAVLTNEQMVMLTAYAELQSARAERVNNMARMYNVGKGATESAEFMLQMAITSPFGRAISSKTSNAVGKFLLKRTTQMATKNAMQKVAKWGATKASRLLAGQSGNLLASAARVPFMWSTGERISEQALTVDNDGKLADGFDAYLGGVLDTYKEVVTEGMGRATTEAIGSAFKVTGVSKILDVARHTKPGEFVSTIYRKAGRTALAKATGWDGLGEEFLEEMDAAVFERIGGNPDALKDFFEVDNVLTTIGTLVPMSVIGGATSAASIKFAEHKKDSANQMLAEEMARQGYDEEQIAYYLDVMQNTTPKQMSEILTPIINNSALAGASSGVMSGYDANSEDAMAMYTAVKNAMIANLHYTSLNGVYQAQETQQRDDKQAELEEKYGQFYQTRTATNEKTGETFEASPIVETATLNDGRTVFINSGATESGQIAATDAQGNHIFINESDIATITDEAGNTSQVRAQQSLDGYLSYLIMQRKQQDESARMESDIEEQTQTIANEYEIGAKVNLGTEEAPVMGEVVALKQEGDGVTIQSEDGTVRDYSYSELGEMQGTPIESFTDEQLDNAEVEDMQMAEEEYAKMQAYGNKYGHFWSEGFELDGENYPAMVSRVTTQDGSYTFLSYNADGDLIVLSDDGNEKTISESEVVSEDVMTLTNFLASHPFPTAANASEAIAENSAEESYEIEEEESFEQAEEEESPLPLKEDGSVNETTLWNNDPRRWAKWNDEQKQDGGKDSVNYINKAIEREQATLAQLNDAYDNEADFDKRKAIQSEQQQVKGRLEKLFEAQNMYAAQEESATAQTPATQSRQSGPVTGHSMSIELTEQEGEQVDAQHQARFSAARSTAAKREAMQNYINEISQGSAPMTLISMDEYEKVMTDAGCTPNQIAQVKFALEEAKQNGESIPAFFVPRVGIFAFVENIPNIEQLRLTYVHERQHQFTAANKKYLNALLQLGLSRERLAGIVATLSGNHFYDQFDELTLADEVISYAMERAYTYEDFSVALQELGVEQEIIDIITEIDNEQRFDNSTYPSRRRGRYDLHDNSSQQRDRTEDDRNSETVSGGLLGSQGDRSLSSSRGRVESREGAESVISEEQIDEEPSSPMMAAAQQDGASILFNVRTEESLQDKIRKFAKTKDGKNTGWTEDDIESIIAETESLIDAIHKSSTGNEFYDEFSYKEPTIRVDWRDGEAKPIVTWTRANIEYKYDMSADLLCINNEGLEQVLSSDKMVALMEMFIPEGKVKKGETPIKFTSEDYLELYNTLKDLGFVVPCKGCFDAAGRFKMLPSVAQKFAAEVNAVIDERNKDPKAFDDKLKAKSGEKTIDGLPTTASTKSAAIAVGVAGDNLTEHVKWTQLMSADGQTKMLSDWGGIFRAWQRTGAGRPKDKLLPEPYYGDIVSSVSTIIGKYGEKTPSFRDILVNQGTGLRRNSHSEFRPVLAIDEIQFMRDAFIRNLTVFKYMKELDDVRLFGKMGVKFNMSFFPEYVPGTKVAGLDKDGNYIASEESVGSREFPYQGEDGKRHYDGMKGWAEAQKYINKDVSLSSVIFSIPHLLKALTDVPTPSDMRGIWGSLIPFHSSGATTASLAMQGLGMARANGVGHGFIEAFSDYGKGVTNFEAVQNDRFGEGWYIVSGKKAGENVEPGHKLEFANGNHYYNQALGVHLFASGYILDSELPEGALAENGELNITDQQKKALMHNFTIDYNDKVRELKGPYAYKDAADYYISELPKLGLIPRFDFEVSEEKFLEMCEAANVDPRHPKLGWKGEGNSWSPIDSEAYYSLFCDYGMTDPTTGEWAPHMPVGYVNEEGEREFRLPENAVEIVKEGLDRFSEVRRSEAAKIDNAIETFAERSVEKGRLSQKDVDKVLGKKSSRSKQSGIIDVFEEAKKAVAREDAKGDVSFRITPRTEEQRKKLFADAKERFGVTNNFKVAGYMLPDGSLLDFSEANDGGDPNVRSLDHRSIEDVIMEDGTEYDSRWMYLADFMNEGAIRLLPEYAGINLMKAPTKEQRQRLMDFIYKYNGEVILEIADERLNNAAYVEYDRRTSPSRIFRDIDGYFNEGIVPQQDIRFRVANENQTIFVSNAAKAVEGIKMEKATPEQWLKMIEKNGGLKAGEDKWMGLSDWLKDSDKKTLTKDEVLDFVNEHMIQIEEQHYDINAEDDAERAHGEITEKLQDRFDHYEDEYYQDHDWEDGETDNAREYAIERLREEMGDTFPYTIELEYGSVYLTFPYEEEDDLVKWAEKTGVKYTSGVSPINETRLNYTTDGLKNKHEIALTVPSIESWNEGDDIHFGDAGDGRAVAWIRFGETEAETSTEESKEAWKEVQDYIAKMREKYGPHSEAWTLAENKQYSDLLKKVSESKRKNKVLVIDEIQSKRHQEGREKGYMPNLEKEYEKKEAIFLEAQEAYVNYLKETYNVSLSVASQSEVESLRAKDAKLQDLWEVMQDANGDLKDVGRRQALQLSDARSVPDAPFDKNWHELAMKRMLRYAAENGYDYIAWTKGDQQAERYGLSNIVESILAEGDWYDSGSTKQEEKTIRNIVITMKSGGNNYYAFNKDGVLINGEYEGKHLSELVGKELAQKLINAKPYERISGDGLKVGGEGMKGFYDKMLPAFMNKYGKKWGVKVSDIELPNVEKSGRIMHSVPVTEEMKTSVMEGQVMFRISESKGANESIPNYEFESDLRFRLSKNNRELIGKWLNKRGDLTEQAKEETLDMLDQFDDATLQLSMGKWFAQNAIRLPDDVEKCMQAVASAKKAKVDPMKFAAPMEIIDQYGVTKPKDKPINPDKVSTLSKVRELPNGLAIYDVEESEESRKNMREIINTHFGKESSPWCLLQGNDKGELTKQSAEYWKKYNAYPKQVVFKDGKLLAFCANDTEERRWWDRMDKSYAGIPVNEKLPNDRLGRSRVVEYNEETGKQAKVNDIKKSVTKDGMRSEWTWRTPKENDIKEYRKVKTDTEEMVEGFDRSSWNIPSFLQKMLPKESVRFVRSAGVEMTFDAWGKILNYWDEKTSIVYDGNETAIYTNDERYLYRNGKLVDIIDANNITYTGAETQRFSAKAKERLTQAKDIQKNAKSIAKQMVADLQGESLRFRVRGEDETAMEFQQSALDDFKKEYNILTSTTVVDVNDRDAVAAALGYTPDEFTDEMYDGILEGYKKGGSALYERETRRIAIFVKESMQETPQVYDNIFHENTHWLEDEHPEILELGEWLWQNSKPGLRRRLKEAIIDSGMYEGEEAYEMLAAYAGYVMSHGKAEVSYAKTPSELQKHWELIFNAFGYEPKGKEIRRRGIGDYLRRVGSSWNRRNAKPKMSTQQSHIQDLSAEERRIIGEYFPDFNKTEDVKMRVNSQGKELTEGQREFFANSKAVDKDGNLLVLYHGTPRAGFAEFKSGWFTTSKEDAISYSGDRKGRLFDPNEEYVPETLTAGDYRLGYMTFDSEEDRAEFLERFPYADEVMSERDYENARMEAEDEEYDALTARRKEFAEVWNAYREYERDRFVDTTVGDLIANPEAYTEEDLMRAMLEYDSNATFDSLDDMSTEERKDALVSALQTANEETDGGILNMAVPTRVPRNGEGVKHNDLGNRTYEVYANVENPYEIDAKGRGSEFESGDVYKAVEDALADEQYDGVIIRNWRVGRTQQLGDVVVPKDGSQIKLTSNESPTESDAIRFRTIYGGNKGYVGYSMSKRAAEARSEGRYPKTDFRKEYNVTTPALDLLVYCDIIDGSEWHHTSMYGNRTTFYGWYEDDYSDTYTANKKEIDALAREYKKRTSEYLDSGRKNHARLVAGEITPQEEYELNREADKQYFAYLRELQNKIDAIFNPVQPDGDDDSDTSFRVTGTPTDEVVNQGLKLSLDEFADLAGNIFAALPEDKRARAAENASHNNWDLQKATYDIVAELAEKEDWTNEEAETANTIAEVVSNALINSGVKLARPLTSNEALWMVYRSTNAINEADIIGAAKEMAVARNLGFGSNVRFKVLSEAETRNIDEIVAEGKMTIDKSNKEAADAFAERINRINGHLSKIRMATAAQREYDQKTIKSITDLATMLISKGMIGTRAKHEMIKLLAITRDAVGKKDLSVSADRLFDLMIANQLRYGKDLLSQYLKVRGKKVDARGVEIQGKLDVQGQQIMQTFKEAITLSAEALAERIAIAENNLESSSETVRRNAENDLVALNLAQQYIDEISESEIEEKNLRKDIKDDEALYKDGKVSREVHNQFVKATYEAIRENRMQRVNAYQRLIKSLAETMAGSISKAAQLREAEKKRIQDIQHYANSDMQGMPSDEHGEKESVFWNSAVVRFFLKPLATFDQMLRHFAPKSRSGEGYLWNHFMGGWLKSTEKEYKGIQEAHEQLDKKVKSIFGKKIGKWSDLFSIEKKMPKAQVSFWDGGQMKDHELTQGNLLYIYMVNKMTDGKMKLRKMGITEEMVDAIVRNLDPRFVELADWMQEEFLPSMRDKYNAVHEKMFGAPMAAIDNYFPIRVLANARVREVDLGVEESNSKPSTITGSIIKRTKNSLALDILGSDAFDVMLEHIQQMEHWAAFAEFNRDLNTLLSYKKFRNRVQNMSGIYGSGKTVWNNFRAVAELAAGVYKPAAKMDSIDKTALNIAKGVTGAKIAFRIYTAIKQLLSMPAFVSDANILTLSKNIATPWVAWNWAMKELPLFEKRWKSREAGDSRLMQTDSDWKLWKSNLVELAGRYGMSPNAFIDALTVSIGAKSIYETKKAQYLKDGYSNEQAEEKAKRDATVLFNESQQSNESAFLSTMQVDRTVASVAFTVFRNSSMGYQRLVVDSWRNISRMLKKGYKEESIEYMKKQMIRDGLSEQQAERAANRIYNRSFVKSAARLATFQFLVTFAWSVGGYLPYLLVGGDGDDKEEMLKDAAIRGLVGGPIEGLAAGSILSNIFGNLAKGESIANVSTSLLPIVSDIEKTIKMLEYDKVAAVNEMFNLLVQAGVGVNPQTFTDIIVAVNDACDGDLETSKEALICMLRMLQVPQSQIEKIYMDEIGFTVDKGLDLRIEEFAKRYAEYKMNRNTPVSGWLYSDEEEKKREDKYITKFIKTAEAAKRTKGNEEAKSYYEYLDGTYTEIDLTLKALRKKVRDAAKEGDREGVKTYRNQLKEFSGSDLYKDNRNFYARTKAIEKLRKAIKSVKGDRREAIEDKMLEIRNDLVEDMREEQNSK